MREIFVVFKNRKCLLRMLISGVLFLLLAAPFRALLNLIPGVTEVRPANMLPVVFGLAWGPAGAWGTAIANACSDIFVSHSPLKVWLPGFFINFFFSYLPYKLWYSSRKQGAGVRPPSLESVHHILKYIYVCLMDSLVVTTFLGLLFEVLGFQAYSDSVGLLFFNNFDFAIVLGVPFILVLTNSRSMELWLPLETQDTGSGKTASGSSSRIPLELPLAVISAVGVLYYIAVKAGAAPLHTNVSLVLMVLIGLVLLWCLTQPMAPLEQNEEDSLTGMSIRAKVILGFLAISLAFVILIGAASWLALSPHEESRRDMWQYIYVVVGVALNLLFAISLLFLRYVENSITSPLEHLSKIVSQFANRDHRQTEKNEQFIEKFEPPRTGDEIQALSTSFKQMMIDITGYVENLEIMTREKERIGAELHVATQIQADMLPRIFPPFPERREFDIYASMNPAKEVGGDFYDFFLVDNRHFAVVIADVSGKGVPAALFMVIAKTLIKSHAQFGNEPADIFTITNNQLCEGNEAGLFVTAWMGILDLHTGDLSCVNAGHNPPLIRRKDGTFEYIKMKPGFVLAGLEDMQYTQTQLHLDTGDTLFLYTDGVTEAENTAKEQYGDARLRDELNRLDSRDPKTLIQGIRQSVAVFADGAEQFDDITMTALTYHGPQDEEEGAAQ